MPFLYLALPDGATRKKFVYAVLIADAVLLPMYVICPGAGPVYLLHGHFPERLMDLYPHVVNLPGVPLNASPSGHVAWVLLMFWFANRYCRLAVRIVTGIYMVLTCLATIGMGEHYVVDLILAVPFARSLWALVHRQWSTAAISTMAVVLWLIAFQQGWTVNIPPTLAWIFSAVTLSAFVMERRTIEGPETSAAGKRRPELLPVEATAIRFTQSASTGKSRL
jgi:hypothetical protein